MLEVFLDIRYNENMKNNQKTPAPHEPVVDLYMDRVLGRYEKVEGTKAKFIYLLHQHGTGSTGSFKIYWGRVDAKKHQSRPLGYFDVMRVHREYIQKGYQAVNGHKTVSALEKDLLMSLIDPVFLAKKEETLAQIPKRRI